MINMSLIELTVTSLPAHEVPDDQKPKDAQTSRASPVNKRVSKEIVLDNAVIPGAHAKTNIEYWPLPELRRKVVLLIWIRDKGIVRCHHSDIQVDEIF